MSLNFDYLLKYAFYWIINTHFELYMHFVDLYIHFVAQPPLPYFAFRTLSFVETLNCWTVESASVYCILNS